MIEEQGITIKEAAAQLDINYSTAKHIMKLYKETGHIKSRVITKKKYVSRLHPKFRTIKKKASYERQVHERTNENESMSHLSDEDRETNHRMEEPDLAEEEGDLIKETKESS